MSNTSILVPSLVALNIARTVSDNGIAQLKASLASYGATVTKARGKVNACIQNAVLYNLSLKTAEARKDAHNTLRETLKGTPFLGSFDTCMSLIRDGLITSEEQFLALDFTSQERENKSKGNGLGLDYLKDMLERRIKKVSKMITVGDATNKKEAELAALALLVSNLENISNNAK